MRSLNIEKSKLLMDYQSNNNIEFSFLSETWFHDEENCQTSFFRELGDYNVYNNPRVTDTWGGGICVLANKRYMTKRTRMHTYVSFEVVTMTLIVNQPRSCKLKMVCLYRKDKIAFSLFCEEFTAMLNDVFLVPSPILICGDFNIPWNNQDSYKTKKLKNILLEYNLYSGYIPSRPTHEDGNTIDLILCDDFCKDILFDVYVDKFCSSQISDHFPVNFSLKVTPTKRKLVNTVNKRRLNNINYDIFISELLEEINCRDQSELDSSNFSTMISIYNDSMSKILDKHAPVYECTVKHTERPGWMDYQYINARAERRKLERTYKRTGLSSDKKKYENQRDYCIELVHSKRSNFFSNRIQKCNGNQKALFNAFSDFCDYKTKTRILPESSSDIDSANDFNVYFTNKVQTIHQSIKNSTKYVDSTEDRMNCKGQTNTSPENDTENTNVLSTFEPTTFQEISELFHKYGIKNSPSDPAPAPVLTNCSKNDEYIKCIVKLVNISLETGSMDGLKNAVVSPLFKKLLNLDVDAKKSYRPVSQLPNLSKIIERVVLKRLNAHMVLNDLNQDFQHGYKKNHSTETLLLKFLNDLIVGIDSKLGVVVLLIDLSAAFDTVNHSILLNILAEELSISGVALLWFKSFLTGRSQQVKINDSLSDVILLECGVAQGSVLGPVLYNIYSRSVRKTFSESGFECLAFADDKNGFMLFSLSCEYEIFKVKVPKCLKEVENWASAHLLKINTDKTEILVFGNQEFLKKLTVHGIFTDNNQHMCIRFAESAKYLGVWLDTSLTFDVHVSNMISSGYAKLRKIRSFRKCLTKEDTETLIHAFISNKMDICNVLLTGVNNKLIRKLQKLQNAAMRTIFQLPIRSPVSHLYSELHWLNVEQRIVFKVILFVFKAINGKSPDNISTLIHLRDPVRMITKENLFFPKSALGKRAFCFIGPRYWNVLPTNIRLCTNIDKFKRLLKSHLLLEYHTFKTNFNAKIA